MRSAETSGVDGTGFGLFAIQGQKVGTICAQLGAALRRFAADVSPVTLAVGLTALLAAGLSVVADAARTHHEGRVLQQLNARIGDAQPAADWPVGAPGMIVPASPGAGGPNYDGVWLRGAAGFGIALLITGLSFRRRRVADARQRRDALLESLPFGVACWTREGRLVACNDHYRALLGTAERKFAPGCSYEAVARHLVGEDRMRPVSEGRSGRVMELARRDGSCLLIDERPLAHGGFITLVTDATAQRRTDHLLASVREEQRLLARRYNEEKLRAEAASRSKTAFLAHLSHDIRTPLNHIIGFAEMMRQQTYGPLGDARYLDYVESMRDSGERLLGFFASILELAEFESGRKALVAEPLMVDELMRQVRRRYAAQAQRAGVILALGASCGARLLGDRFSLERMLGNLIENAIRFTPAGGRVTLAAMAAADGVVLEITDTGIGMSEERLSSLAQPFALGDAAFTREHGGAGLGIPIARAIAELSGGCLAIDSRPALGTTVAISLPMRAAEQAEAA